MSNIISARYKTLGELRKELRARLGFMVSGPGAENNRVVLNSFLQEGHEYVCQMADISVLRKEAKIKLSANSYLYDYHNDAEDEPIEPNKVISICIQNDGMRQQLMQGNIGDHDDTGMPERYDTLNGQIELAPTPDQDYQLIVEYFGPRSEFTKDSDRPSCPDRLVFLYALMQAKAHYRHSDAQVAGQTFERMMARFKAEQFENKRYFISGRTDPDYQVVSTANGYRLKV